MLSLLQKTWIFLVVAALMAANLFYFFGRGVTMLGVLPVVVLIAHQLVFQPSRMVILVAFFTPFSLDIEFDQLGGAGLFLPTEPIIIGLMLLYFGLLLQGFREDKRLLKHPVSIAIFISLLWIFITSLTSELPMVSLKFFLMRLWFVSVMYFMINRLFKQQAFQIHFLKAYMAGLVLVMLITIVHHAINGFSEESAHWVMNPFYKDHTSYGALLAMFFPLMITWATDPKEAGWRKAFLYGLVAFFAIAIVLSYTRAAWVSLIGALGVFTVMKLRIPFRYLAVIGAILMGLFFSFQEQLILELHRNEQDSSDNFAEHVQSITNVKSDASNVERLNRWGSAWRMFVERPVTGWGPGTYMFVYGAYQLSYEKTIISTNHGDMGNAHSEYLGPLAESGLLGLLYMILLLAAILYTGVRLYFQLAAQRDRRLCMALLLGLVTYFIHGFLNNFLDTDKASVPFWGFVSILVALDLYAEKLPALDKANGKHGGIVEVG